MTHYSTSVCLFLLLASAQVSAFCPPPTPARATAVARATTNDADAPPPQEAAAAPRGRRGFLGRAMRLTPAVCLGLAVTGGGVGFGPCACGVTGLSSSCGVCGGSGLMAGFRTIPSASANELSLAPCDLLFDELADLKAQVRQGLRGSPVKRVVGNTLEPLQRALEKNPNNSAAQTTQALELKGHMAELAQAMGDASGYDEYVSKSTKATYPGGKVERELEEAVETVGEYCKGADCSQILVAR